MSERRTISWSRILRVLLALAVSAYLLQHLLRKLEVSELLSSLRSLPVLGLAAAFGLYLLLGVLRALRFRFLLDQGGPLWPLVPIAFAHNLLVRTLPWLTGEISYPALVRRHLGHSVSQAIASLVGARLAELLFVLAGGLLALLALDRSRLGGRDLLLLVYATGTVAAIAGVFLLGPSLRLLARLLLRLERRGARPSLGAAASWAEGLAVRVAELWRSRLLGGNLLLTALTYLTSLGFQLLLLRTAGVDAPLPLLVAIVSLVNLVAAVPISVGGLGVVEGGWSFGLHVLAGVPLQRAVALAFLLHGVQLLCALLSGGLGWGWLWLRRWGKR